MAPNISKKRKVDHGIDGKIKRPSKKVRKQADYDSSSSPTSADEFDPIDLADSDTSPPPQEIRHAKTPASKEHPLSDTSTNSDFDSGSDTDDASSQTSSTQKRKTTKRNDPDAFSNSLNAILSSKLTTSKRSDPVLARSKTALQASHELAESKLETKARRQLRDQKRKESERGRVKDVLLGDRIPSSLLPILGIATGQISDAGDGEGVSAAQIAEQERRLRKTAQRGVVKLFNAVRAAQAKGEEAARQARERGVVGQARKEERVGEMSKKGFLDLIAGGGAGKGKVGTIEEG